jgi:integrase
LRGAVAIARVSTARLRCACRAALPRIRFHDLRHTAATLMLSRGVHPKIAGEMLGHSTIAITLDLYSHVTPTMQRDAAAAVDGVFGS